MLGHGRGPFRRGHPGGVPDTTRPLATVEEPVPGPAAPRAIDGRHVMSVIRPRSL